MPKVGIAASYALWVVSDNFALFVLARAVGGISKANVSLATAVMADITDNLTRAKAMVTFYFIKISLALLLLMYICQYHRP